LSGCLAIDGVAEAELAVVVAAEPPKGAIGLEVKGMPPPDGGVGDGAGDGGEDGGVDGEVGGELAKGVGAHDPGGRSLREDKPGDG
jgi:hypothetical protein